ncbi:hypothetical protein GW17_00024673 [Ensete ventricosum]|nr:hypothetical protein GW17_00024673 [Ensete ventricosum]RZS14454.1 hypothetical protein BHM03_00046145 [Ensete ventricosum]
MWLGLPLQLRPLPSVAWSAAAASSVVVCSFVRYHLQLCPSSVTTFPSTAGPTSAIAFTTVATFTSTYVVATLASVSSSCSYYLLLSVSLLLASVHITASSSLPPMLLPRWHPSPPVAGLQLLSSHLIAAFASFSTRHRLLLSSNSFFTPSCPLLSPFILVQVLLSILQAISEPY